MKLGLDVFLEQYVQAYKGKRIGLVTNMTGVNRNLVPTIDLFYEHPELELVALYGPEHGIRGDAKEGEEVGFAIDPYTNLPVYSLYGETKKPTAEMLEAVDVLFFDLQDIGARYYTYIYTMAYVMEACGEQGKPFVVLDRPNPIGGLAMEGNLLESEVKSFVGLYPIPNRHGLTVGELALIFKHEFNIHCDVTVIPMEGWDRAMYFDQTDLFWVASSPNTTGIDMCTLYPGTCLIEGTNLSEGRGTTRPFEYIGAPFIDGYQLAKRVNQREATGVIARPISFVPTYQKFAGERCEGIQLHITDRQVLNSVGTGIKVLESVIELYPKEFAFREEVGSGKSFFDLLAGTKQLRQLLLQGRGHDYLAQARTDLEQFKQRIAPYLLYR